MRSVLVRDALSYCMRFAIDGTPGSIPAHAFFSEAAACLKTELGDVEVQKLSWGTGTILQPYAFFMCLWTEE